MEGGRTAGGGGFNFPGFMGNVKTAIRDMDVLSVLGLHLFTF